ncbi:replicative DNA helicase [Breznakia sp. PF5-3]|uniref:replicative DNA helicase n=1 Tax=unclassified Breznakia TaxID=2623764 RepID=UPI00240729CA|nr:MULTISPECIES: replicative DNA helicase [unclassified Breznakia]MDL2276952.1 replicative DNA helicase [Breznakia sp. OttesenSCG-928-G09]MDF9824789.1 replicative DNA helicase [Breznakia sp. PM6-1]MDF9835755.1 replicative DNA helicase [Breznakia sp. PF5-3]MDF9837841.1 replicative DNA helicase [Breznakia sp. PFB2-8]MDF9859788.1 replicative DNA helicase [Breznakia sp. PH5-24]
MSRELPHNNEAEQAILGALLIYPKVSQTVYDQDLSKDDFYLEAHKRIFDVMVTLMEEGKPIDPTSIISKLQDREELALVGGADYILLLSDSAVTSANVNYYIEIVKNKADARRLIETAERIAEEGFDTSNELDVLLDEAEKQILYVTRNRRVNDFQNSSTVVSNVMNEISELQKSKDGITGVKTGFRRLDEITNGLQRGDLIILAARPSVGKTAFALNLGLRASKNNKKTSNGAVAIFSLEMPAEQLMKRMLSAQSEVEGNKLRNGQLNNDEMNKLYEAATKLTGCKLYIDDSSSIKMAEIFSKCRKLKAEEGLDLVVIDYLQLIEGSGRRSSDSRQQEVSEISRSLKMLARELSVPVIALSQLSRSVEQRAGDKRPMLSDLRESGAIEQDADIVMFLYREDYHNTNTEEREKEDEVQVEVSLQKHRNGATGTFELSFKKSVNAFYDFAKPAFEGFGQ